MKHIAWDFDGTIIDVFHVWRTAVATVCKDKNLTVPDDSEIKLCFGNTEWKGFPTWNFPLEIQHNYRFLAYERWCLIQKNNPEEFFPVIEVINTIRNLTAEGYLQSVVTSRPRQMLLDMLNHLNIKDNFQYYNTLECAKEQHLKDKPAPDKLFSAISHLSAHPGNTLLIGDTCMDIGMAINAKVQCIGVTWGMGTEVDLKNAGANLTLTSPALLEKTIQSSFS